MHLLTYTPVCRKRKPRITNEKRIRRELTNLREDGGKVFFFSFSGVVGKFVFFLLCWLLMGVCIICSINYTNKKEVNYFFWRGWLVLVTKRKRK